MILDLALEHKRLELAQEDAPDARIAVVPEEVFEEEVEVVERDAGAGAGPHEAFEEVSAVDAPIVRRNVGGVGEALFGEGVAGRSLHEVLHFLADCLFPELGVIWETVAVAGCFVRVVRSCKIDSAQKVAILDEGEYPVRPSQQSANL